MKEPCGICGGLRIIRLPYRRPPAPVLFEPETIIELQEQVRTYPCPECGHDANPVKVKVLDYHSIVDNRIPYSEIAKSAQRQAAHGFVNKLLEGGYILFEKGPDFYDHMTYPLVATLGVVSSGYVASLEERVRERQDQVAKVVVQKAKAQIANWGSSYGTGVLGKDAAYRLIDDTLRHVLSNWSKASNVVDSNA